MKIMTTKLLSLIFLLVNLSIAKGQDYTMAPNGSFVGGDSWTMTPDGNFVGN